MYYEHNTYANIVPVVKPHHCRQSHNININYYSVVYCKILLCIIVEMRIVTPTTGLVAVVAAHEQEHLIFFFMVI